MWGEVATLFLTSVFLSSIPEQPKGGGLTGQLFMCFEPSRVLSDMDAMSRFSEQLGQGHLGWWRKGTCSPVEKTRNGVCVTPGEALSVAGGSLIGWA